MSIEYIKFSDERSRKYCIETRIERNEYGKRVIKSAIFPEGIKHLENIVHYSQILKERYSDVRICEAKLENEQLIFPYIEGKMLSDLYIQAADAEDRDKFAQLLRFHKELVLGNPDNQIAFSESEQSRSWFGNLSEFEGTAGLKISNFDAIAGNIIIQDQQAVFIDYEWVFEFPLPVDLVVYHCIRDEYLHCEKLEEVFSLREAIALLGISCDIRKLEKAYEIFFKNVIEDEDGKTFAAMKHLCLKKTEKIPYDLAGKLCDAEDQTRNLNCKISALQIELDKNINYWKQSDQASRFWEQRANYLNCLYQEYGTLDNVKRIIEEKDTHIANYQAQVQHMKKIYDLITQNILAKALKKIKRALKK